MSIIHTRYDNTKCRACKAPIPYGTECHYNARIRGVACMACGPDARATTTPANGTPTSAMDPQLQAALADGQALRVRIGEMAVETMALRADVTRMNAAALVAATEIETLRKERDRLTLSLTHTQNVLGNVQRERAALVAAGHNAIDDGPDLINVMAPGGVERWLEHDLAQIAAEKATAAEKADERWLAQTTVDQAVRELGGRPHSTERQAILVVTDDDCPI